MARVTVKETARLKALTPALLRLFLAVLAIARETFDVDEIVITSINDGTHAPNSRHYTNEAIDLRTRNFATEAAKLRFASALRNHLGPDFTVLYEDQGGANQHLHLQVRKNRLFDQPLVLRA